MTNRGTQCLQRYLRNLRAVGHGFALNGKELLAHWAVGSFLNL